MRSTAPSRRPRPIASGGAIGSPSGARSPPAAGVVRPVANASRSPLFHPPEPQHRNSPAFARVSGPPSRNTIRNSSRNGPEPQRRWRLTEPLRASLMWGTGQEHQRRGMLPLYATRIEDLGQGDFVKVDCARCRTSPHGSVSTWRPAAPGISCGSFTPPRWMS